jgi:cellulose synthase/poly-beta-1,6-N-acetylglucosamine synthase-like glycosyltransferase
MYWLIIPVALYSMGLFALWLILVRKHVRKISPGRGSIRVSVVIAARNEEKTIGVLLKSLARQDHPHDLLEIVVVNDGSTDRTPIVVSEFISDTLLHSSPDISLINNPFTGKKGAVRYGIGKATGQLILTTDADCEVGPGWVSAFAGYYASTGCDMILGEVYQRPAAGFASMFGRLEFSALQGVTEAAVAVGLPVMCNGANMGFLREVYMRHSDELRDELPSGDDMFLMHAVRRAGGRIGYAGSSAAAVVTASAVTAAALLQQRARWASKAYYYNDGITFSVAAATAACNAAVTAAALISVFMPQYLLLAGSLYAIRLMPDLLMTRHNIKKREKHFPLLIFLLSELIYPFYFMTVAIMSLFPSSRRFARKS